MRVLALDTTTRSGGVALIEDHRLVAERIGDSSRTHAERLPGEILWVLDRYGLRSSDIDVFAVAVGPGSFTGLRVGIATIQGLAMVNGRRIAAVSALEAAAQAAGQQLEAGALVGVWLDAARGEVFSALYRLESFPPFDSGRLRLVDGPSVLQPVAVLDGWQAVVADASINIAGSGATLHAASIRERRPNATITGGMPLAGAIGLIGAIRAARHETVEPSAVRPLYVRRPDAEVDRDRREALTRGATRPDA